MGLSQGIFSLEDSPYFLRSYSVEMISVLPYSTILPSVDMVTTCQGINLSWACNARITALSKPPQQGTCMRTTVMLFIRF